MVVDRPAVRRGDTVHQNEETLTRPPRLSYWRITRAANQPRGCLGGWAAPGGWAGSYWVTLLVDEMVDGRSQVHYPEPSMTGSRA